MPFCNLYHLYIYGPGTICTKKNFRYAQRIVMQNISINKLVPDILQEHYAYSFFSHLSGARWTRNGSTRTTYPPSCSLCRGPLPCEASCSFNGWTGRTLYICCLFSRWSVGVKYTYLSLDFRVTEWNLSWKIRVECVSSSRRKKINITRQHLKHRCLLIEMW